MQPRPTERIAIVLRREAVESRWEDHHWSLHGILPDVGGEPRILRQDGACLERIFPGFAVTLFADEAEGYYLNVSTEEPSVFVALRLDEASGEPYPLQATLSYNEAARWMDGGERVERVVMWRELAFWMADWVAANYRPEPKKRQRPRSFEGQEGRLREKGDA
ncbi:MAG TPA: DUF3305 domain-containing protein [Usitatibacter sp.]|jgi:hypothetical protein|nr:DUF3305 domain-containing protein [Usitatibacter sp.]